MTTSPLLLANADDKAEPAPSAPSQHPEFHTVQVSRPPFDAGAAFHMTQAPEPDWKLGGGANGLQTDPAAAEYVTIDPHEPGRSPRFNYKLMLSCVVPRPIAVLSTCSADAVPAPNLAPFSYFQMVNYDPPLFVISFTHRADGRPNDSLRNLMATRQCVINIASETFAEAVNSASVNTPYGSSEWAVAGLTQRWDCECVRPPRIAEAVVSVEATLESLRPFASRVDPSRTASTLAVLEGVRFWVRRDAINDERNHVDLSILRPLSRLGSIAFGRTLAGFEIPRPDYEADIGGSDGFEILKAAAEAQPQPQQQPQ